MIGLIGDNEAESRLSLPLSPSAALSVPPAPAAPGRRLSLSLSLSLPHVKVMAQKEEEGTLIKRECSASEFDEVSLSLLVCELRMNPAFLLLPFWLPTQMSAWGDDYLVERNKKSLLRSLFRRRPPSPRCLFWQERVMESGESPSHFSS